MDKQDMAESIIRPTSQNQSVQKRQTVRLCNTKKLIWQLIKTQVTYKAIIPNFKTWSKISQTNVPRHVDENIVWFDVSEKKMGQDISYRETRNSTLATVSVLWTFILLTTTPSSLSIRYKYCPSYSWSTFQRPKLNRIHSRIAIFP